MANLTRKFNNLKENIASEYINEECDIQPREDFNQRQIELFFMILEVIPRNISSVDVFDIYDLVFILYTIEEITKFLTDDGVITTVNTQYGSKQNVSSMLKEYQQLIKTRINLCDRLSISNVSLQQMLNKLSDDTLTCLEDDGLF